MDRLFQEVTQQRKGQKTVGDGFRRRAIPVGRAPASR
jgi:hypothetical protein